jgi:hypothetical protein
MKKPTPKTKTKAATKKKTVLKATLKVPKHFTVAPGKTSYWPPKDGKSLYYIIYAGKKGSISNKPMHKTRDVPLHDPPPQFLPQAMPIMPNGDGTFTIVYSTTTPSSTPGSTASTPESTD